MNVVEWCRKNDIWYLKIDLKIPDVIMVEAESVYNEGFFIPHRGSDGTGWLSSSLHGWAPNDERDTSQGWRFTKNPDGHGYKESEVKWGYTEVSEVAPEMTRWLKEFPHKSYRRCRFMLIKPQGSISQHHDANEERIATGRQRNIASAINLAIKQPKSNCYLRRVDTKEELPFDNCTGFWFDNGVEHEAQNNSNENRFHFIIHGGMNNARRELMKKSLVKQFGKDVLRELD